MKTLYILTGTSSGIGKALTAQILNQAKGKIVGLSRRNIWQHDNYTHVDLDLSDMNAVCHWKFPDADQYHRMVLINNAGYIGDIQRQGKADPEAILHTYRVNLLAPALLCNAFLQQYESLSATKIILNVSSGAGKRPIDAWGPYCSTKAGLDLLSETIATETEITDRKNTYIFSIAPGVVDTEMQATIRSSNSEDFSGHQQFVELHKHGDLISATEVAQKYLRIIDTPEEYPNTLFSLRDID